MVPPLGIEMALQCADVCVQDLHCGSALLGCKGIQLLCELAIYIILTGRNLITENVIGRYIQRSNDLDKQIHTGHL